MLDIKPATGIQISVAGSAGANCLMESKTVWEEGFSLARAVVESKGGMAEPLRIGTQKQLLVDEFLVAERTSVVRTLGRPVKANGGRPVLIADRPWEDFGTPIVGSVLRDDGKFHMWYRVSGSGANGGVWCYAESSDGVQWYKPELGLIEYHGSEANNIYVIGQPQAYTPFVDLRETDPAKRFKSAVSTTRIDTALAYSADGLHWKLYRNGAAVTGRASDTISQVLWDRFAGVYRLYTRTDFGSGGGSGEVRGTRDLVAAAAADLSDPQSWRKVREWCLGWERGDRQYHRQRQIYSLNGWVHENVQFALIWTLETGADEVMDYYLATTRGEQPWNLRWVYSSQPFIQRGAEGAFDCRWIQPAPSIVTWQDQHWIYYVGLAKSHRGTWSPRVDGPRGGIGLATLRLDGFVSWSADNTPGTVVTKPFLVEGNRLEVNVNAARGVFRVEILAASGEPLFGFSGKDATTYSNVDDIRLSPRWSRKFAEINGQTIKLRFHLRRAGLFSFQVKD